MTLQNLHEGTGYLLGYNLAPQEHAQICSWIRTQWEARIVSCHPEVREKISSLSLEKYHHLEDDVDHPKLWPKTYRIFSPAQVEKLQEMSFFKKLQTDLGPLKIADIEGLGYPEVYWRLVRPNKGGDVAVPHADRWFYNITNNIPQERQQRLYKFWLSIYTEAGQSGLAVQAHSHKEEWKYGAEDRHGRPKPVFLDNPARLDLEGLPLHNGEGVVFHIDLIHKGLSHQGDHTRLSIELALEREITP